MYLSNLVIIIFFYFFQVSLGEMLVDYDLDFSTVSK